MKAITADNLSKRYAQDNKALDSVSITLDEGVIFGFLGPNGAGKTTSVRSRPSRPVNWLNYWELLLWIKAPILLSQLSIIHTTCILYKIC